MKASGPLRAPGVSVRRKRLCTKCNAWSDGRLGNHNQQRRECVPRGPRLQAPRGFRVQCTAVEFRLVEAFRQGIPSHPCSRRNLSCEYFFPVSFWICAENDCSADGYLVHFLSLILFILHARYSGTFIISSCSLYSSCENLIARSGFCSLR